mgnify:CR=1 FL=1
MFTGRIRPGFSPLIVVPVGIITHYYANNKQYNTMNDSYIRYVKSKSTLRYLAGLLIRWKNYVVFQRRVAKARRNGAKIGEGVVITPNVARAANRNLVIGDHSTINNSYLDLRNPVTIGTHVIVGGVTLSSPPLMTWTHRSLHGKTMAS